MSGFQCYITFIKFEWSKTILWRADMGDLPVISPKLLLICASGTQSCRLQNYEGSDTISLPTSGFLSYSSDLHLTCSLTLFTSYLYRHPEQASNRCPSDTQLLCSASWRDTKRKLLVRFSHLSLQPRHCLHMSSSATSNRPIFCSVSAVTALFTYSSICFIYLFITLCIRQSKKNEVNKSQLKLQTDPTQSSAH